MIEYPSILLSLITLPLLGILIIMVLPQNQINLVKTVYIPNHDLLVGGFPCQDYSVATTLHNSKGLKGKKGVLWWSIHQILENKKNKPKLAEFNNIIFIRLILFKNCAYD